MTMTKKKLGLKDASTVAGGVKGGAKKKVAK